MKPRKLLIFTFLGPASILYLAFFLVPAVWAFYYSAFDWSGFTEDMTFVGLKNYQQLLYTDDLFWQSLKHTLLIVFAGGAVTFVLAFLLSVMMNSGVRGKRFFRALVFLPNVVATVALTTMWAFAIYSPRSGVLPMILKATGITAWGKFLWMAPTQVFNSMMMAIIWISVGYYVVLLLAGMDKIPMELYEAAKIEGANQAQMFWRITVPLMWDVITVAVVLWSISAIKVFEFPFTFMGAGEDPNLYTIGVYLYIMGFGKRQPIYRLGYSTAIGVVMLVIVILFSVVLRRFMRREALEY